MPRSSTSFYNANNSTFAKGRVDFSTKTSAGVETEIGKMSKTSPQILMIMSTKKIMDDIIDRALCLIQSKSYRGQMVNLNDLENSMLTDLQLAYNKKKDNDPDTELPSILSKRILSNFEKALKDRKQNPFLIKKIQRNNKDYIYFLSLTGERIG